MSGSPNAVTRDLFGPEMDPIPEVIPTQDVGGDRHNLTWWQLAGCGLMAPKAWAYVSSAGGLVAAAEMWNTRQVSTLHPVVVHAATGCYALVYSSAAPDKDGTSTPIGLQVVRQATPQLAYNAMLSSNWEVIASVKPAQPWVPSTAYDVGTVVISSSKLYICITAGTSAGRGGPSGTGTNITDGGAHWCYLSPASGYAAVAVVASSWGIPADMDFYVELG